MLAQKSKKSKSSKDSDPYGIGRFILGCFLIPFALVLLWKNERKVVYFTKTMDEGSKAVKSVDADDVDDANELELIHISGTTTNTTDLVDEDFGIVAHDSYRLKRKVEMYQWREIVEAGDSDGGSKKYKYEAAWCEEPIDSRSF